MCIFELFFNRYLLIPNVLSAAISRGCTMLHPGYGFLAENAVFVEMCREHGINFIGPNVSRNQEIFDKKRKIYPLFSGAYLIFVNGINNFICHVLFKFCAT